MSLLKTPFGRKGISQCTSLHLLHAYEYTKFTSGSEIKWLLWLQKEHHILSALRCLTIQSLHLFCSHPLFINKQVSSKQSTALILHFLRAGWWALLSCLQPSLSGIFNSICFILLLPFKSLYFHVSLCALKTCWTMLSQVYCLGVAVLKQHPTTAYTPIIPNAVWESWKIHFATCAAGCHSWGVSLFSQHCLASRKSTELSFELE